MLICRDQRNGTGCGTQNPNGTPNCQQCGRPLRHALELHDPGTLVGHYRLGQVIGFGGFGAVYLAEDTQQSGQHVALKETFDPNTVRGFRGEFAVLRNLHHDHLPHYYDMFEAGGNGYLVMELVPGQSLHEVLSRRQSGTPLAESQVLGYAIQLCDVLSYLHGQNPPIIHRDIKPANIRLTPDGLIKLVDFGLLKQGIDTTRSSRQGLTPAYAPLEQWGGAGQHTDPRSDIYSLGATLYHLCTGQAPMAVSTRVASTPDPLPPPQQVNPRLSLHVSQAIMQALALQSHDRYTDASAFKQALLGAGQGAQPVAGTTMAIFPGATPQPTTTGLPWPQGGSPRPATTLHPQPAATPLPLPQGGPPPPTAVPLPLPQGGGPLAPTAAPLSPLQGAASATTTSVRQQAGRALMVWVGWTMATAVGWGVSLAVSGGISAMIGGKVGAFVGWSIGWAAGWYLQRLILLQFLPRAGCWLLASIINVGMIAYMGPYLSLGGQFTTVTGFMGMGLAGAILGLFGGGFIGIIPALMLGTKR